MELTVLERLLLLGLLPAEGDITTLRIVRNLRDALSFSEEEHATLKFTQADGQIHWEPKAERPKAVTIGLKATNLIVSSLTALSEQKKLTAQHLGLWDKFVEAPEVSPPV